MIIYLSTIKSTNDIHSWLISNSHDHNHDIIQSVCKERNRIHPQIHHETMGAMKVISCHNIPTLRCVPRRLLSTAGHGLLSHGAPGGLCHHALSGAAQHEARLPKALEKTFGDPMDLIKWS